MPYTVEEFMTMKNDFKDALAHLATMDQAFSGRTEIHIEQGKPSEYPRRDEKGESDHVHVHVEYLTTNQSKIEEAQAALGDDTQAILGNIAAELASAGINKAPIFPFSITKYSPYDPVEEAEEQEL